MLPAELVWRGFSRKRPTPLPRLFHAGLSQALGLHVVSHGRPARHGPLLFVANHLSWADIPLLGSHIPRAAFIAKADVGQWGLVGRFANLGHTVYVERERRLKAADQRDSIAARLGRGDRLILFPEGTNGDGVRVLPFKSALFSVADGIPDLAIQPVTLAYTRINGLPVTRRSLPALAWVGDTELLPHARDFCAIGRVRAELIFHPLVSATDFADRKALARHCETVISRGYLSLMRTGRPLAVPL
jgi:1-acyl-sn-glycerol-3-phosphate acyltransferase